MTYKKFGRYEIIQELGRGGMATVFLASDPLFKRKVAVKVLPVQFTHDITFLSRFEREAQTIARLEHPAIVPVYDFGEENGQPYLVMSYMSGGSLDSRLREGLLPLPEIVKILMRIAPALDSAHSQGVIHRDLKPGNILFDHHGNAYLADFGIAKLAEATATFTGNSVIGTPAYMSPEQVKGEKLDGRTDIYSFAVIVFEMLTGSQPYEAETPIGQAFKHVMEPIPRVLTKMRDLPVAVDEALGQGLAKKPSDRFITAGEMAIAFKKAVTQSASNTPNASTTSTQANVLSSLYELDAGEPPLISGQTTLLDLPNELELEVSSLASEPITSSRIVVEDLSAPFASSPSKFNIHSSLQKRHRQNTGTFMEDLPIYQRKSSLLWFFGGGILVLMVISLGLILSNRNVSDTIDSKGMLPEIGGILFEIDGREIEDEAFIEVKCGTPLRLEVKLLDNNLNPISANAFIYNWRFEPEDEENKEKLHSSNNAIIYQSPCELNSQSVTAEILVDQRTLAVKSILFKLIP